MVTTNYSTRVRAPTRLVKDQYSNDSVVLNPHSGRAADDVFMNPRKPTENIKKQKNGEGVVSCRKKSIIGTLNVRTVREFSKRLEMVTLFLRSQMTVLAIQEHRVVHDEEVKIERHKKGVHLISTSAWRNRAQASTGGVGFLLTKQAFNAVSLIKTYSKRCMLVSLDGNPRLTIISVYSPTE